MIDKNRVSNKATIPCLLLLLSRIFLFSEEMSHTVEKDETLYSIASRYDISVADLMAVNNLGDSFIKAGDSLMVPVGAGDDFWLVKAGDSLSLIAQETNVSVGDLKAANGMDDEKILIGQKLTIPPGNREDRSYTVKKGDSLWKIADRNQTTVDTLVRLNGLNSDSIQPGLELRLPIFTQISRGISVLKAMLNGREDPEEGPWFNGEPKRRTQPSPDYGELPEYSTTDSYRQAREVLGKLNREIDRAGILSRKLKGWTIVIDPGHGGLDPGAVVETVDGNGNSAFVVEDEYAYDISLRVYALLRQHGADADLTVISPNHHIRHTPDASVTFVNEKNEVFNDESENRTGAWSEWPAGGSRGLERRLDTARKIIDRGGNPRSLFISIHCDNTPGGFAQSGILIWGKDEQELERSRNLAEAFQSSFPASLEIKEQNLHVLNGNPADDGAVLIEIRNINYDNNSWALRNEGLRDQDAAKIVDSLLHFVSTY
jgi:LysM repeat protein